MGLGYYPGIENVDNTISTPETWVRFTQENIRRSQRERAASEKLRGDIDTLLRFCANEMFTAFNGSNNAFNSRIAETVDARNKLQDQLAKVRQLQISHLRNVCDLHVTCTVRGR